MYTSLKMEMTLNEKPSTFFVLLCRRVFTGEQNKLDRVSYCTQRLCVCEQPSEQWLSHPIHIWVSLQLFNLHQRAAQVAPMPIDWTKFARPIRVCKRSGKVETSRSGRFHWPVGVEEAAPPCWHRPVGRLQKLCSAQKSKTSQNLLFQSVPRAIVSRKIQAKTSNCVRRRAENGGHRKVLLTVERF